MKTPWRSLAIVALVALGFSALELRAGTTTFPATPGAGANIRETTDGSGYLLSNMTLWDSAAGANGLTINADHTLDAEGIVSNAGSAVATGSLNIGTIAYNYGYNGASWDQLQVDASKFLKVNVSAGTVAATQSGNWTSRIVGNAGGIMDIAGQNAAQPANSLLIAGEFTTSPTTITTGNASPLQLSSSGQLLVNCATGCSGGSFNNNADAVATSATNGQAAAWLYGFNGTTWDRLRVDGSKNLDVNCLVGCSAGALSNASSGVATSSTNSGNDVWLFGFNGTTWDQLQVDASKNLKVLSTSTFYGAHTSVATTPTVTASAYSSGNDIGGLLTVPVFRSSTQSSGKIDNIMIASKGGSTVGMTVYVFNTTPGTTCTDKTAFSLAAADVSKMAAVSPFIMTPQIQGTGAAETFASVAPTLTVSNAGVSGNIFLCVVVNGAVTPASTTDLVITVAATED